MIYGVYISLYPCSPDSPNYKVDGIARKICSQYNCFEKNGFYMEMLCPYANDNHLANAIKKRLPFYGRNGFGKSGKTYIERAESIDFVYFRKPQFMNDDSLNFLKQLKNANPSIKVILEIPTYPVVGEANHLHELPLKIKEKRNVNKLFKYVDRILTYSKDEEIYGIKTIRTCNAIDIESIKPIDVESHMKNEINLIACSRMEFWHGYDRVIEGLHNYYSSREIKYNVILNLVGEGDELKKYKKMTKDYGLEGKVKFAGYLSGKDLDEEYSAADIALDSMGRHRSGVFYNSSLKSKEYCGKGLPIVSGVSNELDSDYNFKYYFRVPADDSPIDIGTVIEFYERIYCNTEKREEVVHRISEYAKAHFSYDISMQPVFEYIKQ